MHPTLSLIRRLDSDKRCQHAAAGSNKARLSGRAVSVYEPWTNTVYSDAEVLMASLCDWLLETEMRQLRVWEYRLQMDISWNIFFINDLQTPKALTENTNTLLHTASETTVH